MNHTQSVRKTDPLYNEAKDLLASYALTVFVDKHAPRLSPEVQARIEALDKGAAAQNQARYEEARANHFREDQMAWSEFVRVEQQEAEQARVANEKPRRYRFNVAPVFSLQGVLGKEAIRGRHLGRVRADIEGAAHLLFLELAPPEFPLKLSFSDRELYEFKDQLKDYHEVHQRVFRERLEQHPLRERLTTQSPEQLATTEGLVRQALAVSEFGRRLERSPAKGLEF